MRNWAEALAEDYLPDNWERVSSSAYSKVARNAERLIYFKEFLPRSPAESLKALARGSRATRARINSDALLLAGIDAPENIFWGSLPNGSEYLFTAAAPGDSVAHWLRQGRSDQRSEQRQARRQLLLALGTFIGRVHATGFVHGNLQPGNILAAQQQDLLRFTLINNEHNARRMPTPGKLLLHDLMQLNTLVLTDLSRTERMRFFCAWRRQMRNLSTIEAKILAAEAYQLAMQRVDKSTGGAAGNE